MTDPHDEYGEILRRTLHAEAETVVPAADGLDRIRARINERPATRFGWPAAWNWFTESWARPAMAGAAALVMAAVVVSAPPAITSFTVGGHGTPDQGEHGENSTSGGTTAEGGGQPAETRPGPERPQGLSPTRSRPASPIYGGEGCVGSAVPASPVPMDATETPPAADQPPTCAPPTTTTSPTPPDSSEPPDDPPPPSSPPPPEPPPTDTDQPLNQVDP